MISSNFVKKTRRLEVRPFRMLDFAAWKQSYLEAGEPRNKWDSLKKTSDVLTKVKYKEFVSKKNQLMKADRFYDFGVFLRKNGELVGMVSAMEIQRGISQMAYLGYVLFPQYWNKGYGTEAVKAMFDIAFNQIKLHRLEAGIEPDNVASIRLVESLGMRHEGLKKKLLFLRGEWSDLVTYGITCEECGIKWRGEVGVSRG